MSQSDVNRPEARFSFGGCSASVFVNEAKRTDGSSFVVRKVVLQRTYVDSQANVTLKKNQKKEPGSPIEPSHLS